MNIPQLVFRRLIRLAVYPAHWGNGPHSRPGLIGGWSVVTASPSTRVRPRAVFVNVWPDTFVQNSQRSATQHQP